jgi:hypothetical protein
MTERTSPVDDVASDPALTPSRETVVYRTVTQSRQGHLGGFMRRRQRNAADGICAAPASEHAQLVVAVNATDGITMEQAELQVTAFEMQFKDESP